MIAIQFGRNLARCRKQAKLSQEGDATWAVREEVSIDDSSALGASAPEKPVLLSRGRHSSLAPMSQKKVPATAGFYSVAMEIPGSQAWVEGIHDAFDKWTLTMAQEGPSEAVEVLPAFEVIDWR